MKKASSRKILKLLALTMGINRHQVYQHIPKLSEGYVNPKGQKNISKSKAKIPKFSIFLPSVIYEKIQCLNNELKFGSDMPLTYRDLHIKF